MMIFNNENIYIRQVLNSRKFVKMKINNITALLQIWFLKKKTVKKVAAVIIPSKKNNCNILESFQHTIL